MSAAALPHDALLPRPPGGQALGTALSLGVHALLAVALVTAVHWRTSTPDVVSAELWASVPEAAAPPPPPPQPAPPPTPVPQAAPPPPAPAPAPAEPPPKVDIATERAEKARVERERHKKEQAEAAEAARRKKEQAEAEAEAAKKQREAAARDKREKQEKREAAAAEARLEQQREDNLRRMMSQAGPPGGAASAPGPAGAAVRSAAPSASYTAKLVAVIRSNLVFSGDVPGNPVAEVRVRATATGTILSREFVKRSGHAAWDDAVLRAIDKTGTLPRDVDGRVPTDLIVTFRPKE